MKKILCKNGFIGFLAGNTSTKILKTLQLENAKPILKICLYGVCDINFERKFSASNGNSKNILCKNNQI